MSTNRPDFALESYQDKTLPNGKQLRHLGDLAGHTIKAVVTETERGDLVITMMEAP